METRIPNIVIEGPIAFHDQACAVMHSRPAVYVLNDGVFHPSWEAQSKGWHLIHAKTWIQRAVIRYLFGARP